jgi:hypothetical protein
MNQIRLKVVLHFLKQQHFHLGPVDIYACAIDGDLLATFDKLELLFVLVVFEEELAVFFFVVLGYEAFGTFPVRHLPASQVADYKVVVVVVFATFRTDKRVFLWE